ncbi:MAG: transcription termination factor Rho, partial [Anaerolineales bacterium]
MSQMDMAQLETKTLAQLRDLAKEWEISGFSRLKKDDLVLRLLRAKAERDGLKFGSGVLEIVDDN